MEAPEELEYARAAIIRVGAGRGFIVEGQDNYIITAGHCLPHFPPCHMASYTEERTYANLLGPLGQEPTVWAECLFADPIADIAVLGPPDGQELYEEAEAYEALIDAAGAALQVADVPETGQAWMLYLDGQWRSSEYRRHRLGLSFTEPMQSGMSGSPIVLDDGRAIGAVASSTDTPGLGASTSPRLTGNFPGWALEEVLKEDYP